MAIALFGMAGLALTRALNLTARNANITRVELRMLNKLESALTEAHKMARMEEIDEYSEPDEMGIHVRTEILPLEEFETEDGQILQNMWLVRCTALWEGNGDALERVAETYRYEPLYQSQ